MASAAIPLFLCFLTTFVHCVAAQQTNNGSVSVGASLTAAPDAKPWLSRSGEFAFGFQQQPQGNDSFLLSIWYDKIPDRTIVWYPKDGPMVPRGSKAELINRRGLVLSDPQGIEVWTSASSSNDIAYGLMNDTGNFQLVGSNSSPIWESFDHPADTMLPTQIMGIDGEINSKMSQTNFSGGRFQLRLIRDGNLVLNTIDMFTGSAGDAYYASGTNDASNSTNSGYQLIFDVTGYLYILRGNGQRFDLTTRGSLPSGDYYHRATLDSDGIFTQYYYPKNPSSPNTSWEDIKIVPPNFDNICDSGKACGLNNICSLEDNRPKCECPQGFSLYDINSPNGDCAPDFSPSCDQGYYGEEQFELIELGNVNWPGSDYVHLNPINEQDCKTSCLKDCFCAVALHRDINCWKKKLPLSAGRKVPSDAIKTFFKVRKTSDRPSGNSPTPVLSRESKNRASLILVGAALCVVIIVLIVVICVGFFRVYNQKARNQPYQSISDEAIETTLPRFKYQELVNATDGFNDELGQGAFGVVYKGLIGTKPVAVKKLHPVVQNNAQKEFKTEVNTIARTHHKNLVQLLGYCDDGEQRLLIYEYMSNGTLAFYLFGDRPPSWNQRSNIAVGIARGLSYLHEECSAQIIHCDIKPQNILLDDCYNAKIADFGLAKLLKINQSRTHTGIRGTKGYVAPEWFRNTPVSVKVDVYSFGVLLLEIISCRRSVIFESDNEFEILTDLAWDFYHEGRLDAFVKNDMEATNDYKKLGTFVMVGLWCIQENPSLRPTMKKVVQMLEGECGVTEPPCPSPLFVTSC
uniref:G-type lectin S-receptor-like serine/threonine-protein kinase LECRK3 n=1 Tax=Erigeron canadensis TaxID=72917 RepID=UPI001CB8AAEE|nr:G-type lectin S-receptor-like serine/threonine-protein kinase LECRK3 [Erigeron canadensis]